MELLDEVKMIISKELRVPIEQLTPETKLGDLGAESLDVIEIIFALEAKFGIDIPLKAAEATRIAGVDETRADSTNLGLTTIEGIVQAVKARVDAKAGT